MIAPVSGEAAVRCKAKKEKPPVQLVEGYYNVLLLMNFQTGHNIIPHFYHPGRILHPTAERIICRTIHYRTLDGYHDPLCIDEASGKHSMWPGEVVLITVADLLLPCLHPKALHVQSLSVFHRPDGTSYLCRHS